MLDEQLTPLEEQYLAEMLPRVRRLDNTDRGVFAEIVVAASLPGAKLPEESWAPVDVEWNDITIQVKCSGERQSWNPPDKLSPAKWSAPERLHWDAETDTFGTAPGRFADVYVLARHVGDHHENGWTFYVLSTATLACIATPGGGISLTRLTDAGVYPVEPGGLPDAVASARKEER